MIPSTLSRNPPWPGRISLVSFTFALLFKYEINKSPNCDVKDINIVTVIKVKKLNSINLSLNITTNIVEKIKEPIDPDIVLLGLIFVNFLPLKNLPNAKPPMSDKMATKIEYKTNIFKCR